LKLKVPFDSIYGLLGVVLILFLLVCLSIFIMFLPEARFCGVLLCHRMQNGVNLLPFNLKTRTEGTIGQAQ